jgi:hypothetical protein
MAKVEGETPKERNMRLDFEIAFKYGFEADHSQDFNEVMDKAWRDHMGFPQKTEQRAEDRHWAAETVTKMNDPQQNPPLPKSERTKFMEAQKKAKAAGGK